MYGGAVQTAYVHVNYRKFRFKVVAKMAIYTGEVSHKKELGRVRHVVATDNIRVAQVFGVSGFAGSVYSNGKIGMLQLEGDASHAEVAIDPNEMTMSNDYDYIRSHLPSVANDLALADVVAQYDSSLVKQTLARYTREVQFNELSNDERIAIAKNALGLVSDDEVREALANADDKTRLQDAVRHVTAPLFLSKNDATAGIDYNLTIRPGDVTVLDTAKQRRARVSYTVTARVSGSKAVAGAKFKQAFTEVKTYLVELAVAQSELNHSFILEGDDTDAILDDLAFKVRADMRKRLATFIADVSDKFADYDQFNPASTVARIWSDLGLTSTEVPQTNLSLDAVRAYADGEITATQFAEMPENGITNKLIKAVIKRLETADIDALAETLADRENKMTAQPRRIERAIDQFIDALGDVTDFTEAKNYYSADNRLLIDRIMSFAMENGTENENARQAKQFEYFINMMQTLVWNAYGIAFPNIPLSLQAQVTTDVQKIATDLSDSDTFNAVADVIKDDDVTMDKAILEIYPESELVEIVTSTIKPLIDELVADALLEQLRDRATVAKIMFNDRNIYQHIDDEDYIQESAYEVTD